jgi:hypothetical protein
VLSFSGSVCGIVAQRAWERQSGFTQLPGAQADFDAERSARICQEEAAYFQLVQEMLSISQRTKIMIRCLRHSAAANSFLKGQTIWQGYLLPNLHLMSFSSELAS